MPYLANAAQILIEFVFGAIIALLLLRVLTEAWRADFHNPLSQFLYRATNPTLSALRPVLPTWRRINLAALVLAWVAVLVKITLLCATVGVAPQISGLLLLALAELVDFLLVLYVVLIFAWALMSMLSVDYRNPLVPLISQLVGPVMRPLRRRIPTLGGIDFSPAVAILVLLLIRALVLQPLLDVGQRLLV
ncbi:MAG TPA: YggT family protein [Rhodanobacteraceae bacterium]|nr:YggT family protein [Rhodanobacteraceae bacterium]